jgi:hypothetical protein
MAMLSRRRHPKKHQPGIPHGIPGGDAHITEVASAPLPKWGRNKGSQQPARELRQDQDTAELDHSKPSNQTKPMQTQRPRVITQAHVLL